MSIRCATLLFALCISIPILLCSCSETAQQGEWKKLSFMDCNNVTHNVIIKLSNATFDDQSRFLKIEGTVKNNMKEYRLFNVRDWVIRLDDPGTYLKPLSVGLPSLPLAAMKPDGTSREEKFILVYKIEHPGTLTEITLDYADQFFMTGQINRIIISVPMHVSSGTVSYRG